MAQKYCRHWKLFWNKLDPNSKVVSSIDLFLIQIISLYSIAMALEYCSLYSWVMNTRTEFKYVQTWVCNVKVSTLMPQFTVSTFDTCAVVHWNSHITEQHCYWDIAWRMYPCVSMTNHLYAVQYAQWYQYT